MGIACAFISPCSPYLPFSVSFCLHFTFNLKIVRRQNRCYSLLAEYMENGIGPDKLIASIVHAAKDLMSDKYRSHKIKLLLNELAAEAPDEIKEVKRLLADA